MREFIATCLMGTILVLTPTACKKAAPPTPPPPDVVVADVIQKDVPVYSEWVGTLDGFVNAEIRPKVEGYLQKQVYREGAYVQKGDLLFEIDPRQYQAALDQATGVIGRAEATLAKAQKDVERYTPLVAQRAISQQELDNAVAAEQEASAALESAKANGQQARLNLTWTHVLSPINGVVGIAKSQVGDLVNPQTVMTAVSQVDPVKVRLNISEKEYLRYAGRINTELPNPNREGRLELILDDGSVYPHKGKVILVDRQVDIRTGTMAVQGAFPNPGNLLRPGQYAKVRAALETRQGALLVPQRAVSELQGAYQIGVVGPDGKAEIRVVKPGARIDNLWVIENGLNPGEKVIVEGLFRVKPGMAVNAKPAADPLAPAQPPPAASAPAGAGH